MAREIGRDVDPDAIATARRSIRATIAERVGSRLAALADRLTSAEPILARCRLRRPARARQRRARPDGRQRRPCGVARVVERYRDADNMTDRSAALAILVIGALPERKAALEDFYARFRDDALVLDKWLAFEASVPASETLDRVRALLDHPAFSIANPNRVRALVGAFAGGNQTQFNRA